jgi:hypothetical protein
MRIYRIILSLAICFAACSKKEVEVPKDILSQEVMISVLSDMHYAEAMLQLKNLGQNDSTKRIATGYYKLVLEKHHLRQDQFQKSFNFYLSQPETMTAMYDSIITRLSTKNLAKVPQ